MKFDSADILREMEGVEVWSLHFEGLVTVEDGRFHISHSNRRFRPTPLEAKILWNEHFEENFPFIERELKEEFGGRQ